MFILLPALGQPYLSHPILSCFLLCPVPFPPPPSLQRTGCLPLSSGSPGGDGLVWVL